MFILVCHSKCWKWCISKAPNLIVENQVQAHVGAKLTVLFLLGRGSLCLTTVLVEGAHFADDPLKGV